MQRTPARRSSLFLLECIIAILFFIIAATVCIQLFAKAHIISKESEDLTMAVQLTSSYVEEFRGGKSFPSELLIYYDESWSLCEKMNATHTLTITTSVESNTITGHFVMDDIFETSLVQYTGGGIR